MQLSKGNKNIASKQKPKPRPPTSIGVTVGKTTGPTQKINEDVL